MNISIVPSATPMQDDLPIEVVEKKGLGHPDSLADALADAISFIYSDYCLKNFGYILHHNVDKISVLGGRSRAGFGFGEQLSPIRVIINGRMSDKFGSEKVPTFELAAETARKYLTRVIPSLDPARDIQVFDFLNRAGGAPHKGGHWFKPRGVEDLPEVKSPRANDTACVVGFYPLSKIESLTTMLHAMIFPAPFKCRYDFLGTDVKSMVARVGHKVSVTMCIPFLGVSTPNLNFYIEQKEKLRIELLEACQNSLGREYDIDLDLNTRDNPEIMDLYILANGSAVESGDEGVVGRGNRMNGFIASNRPYSIEAPQGKNPTYFGGKIYDHLARTVSERIVTTTGCHNTIYFVTQNGAPIASPTDVMISVAGLKDISPQQKDAIRGILKMSLKNSEATTEQILSEQREKYSFLYS